MAGRFVRGLIDGGFWVLTPSGIRGTEDRSVKKATTVRECGKGFSPFIG